MKDLILPGQGGPQPQIAPIIHQVGMSPGFIGCNMFCANCWPKQVPAFIVWSGYSLCHSCVTPLRKKFDDLKLDAQATPIEARPYKDTWGEEPAR